MLNDPINCSGTNYWKNMIFEAYNIIFNQIKPNKS